MIDQSPLHTFVKTWRNHGIRTAMTVTYFRLRGVLFPALALPRLSFADTTRRQISVLLDASEQDTATLKAIIDVLAKRETADWEICVRQHGPVTVEMTTMLGRLHGTAPWLRIIVSTDDVDAMTASQWTVEQATGEFVAFITPAYVPGPDAFTTPLHRLQEDPALTSALLVDVVADADHGLLLQRKSAYLAAFAQNYILSATNVAKALTERGTPPIHVEATDKSRFANTD